MAKSTLPNDSLALELRLPKMSEVEAAFARPATGWIKSVRRALGMSSSALAKRLGVQVSTITRFEQSEANETIKLETLRKVAEAMDCDLAYVLVPRSSVLEIRKRQALQKANERIARLRRTMELEDQGLPENIWQQLIDREMNELLSSNKIWD